MKESENTLDKIVIDLEEKHEEMGRIIWNRTHLDPEIVSDKSPEKLRKSLWLGRLSQVIDLLLSKKLKK